MKNKETLEEAAERIFDGFGDITKPVVIKRAIELVKWQQERMYSEEEIRQMFNRYNEVIAHRDIEEWQAWIDKQFKKNYGRYKNNI